MLNERGPGSLQGLPWRPTSTSQRSVPMPRPIGIWHPGLIPHFEGSRMENAFGATSPAGTLISRVRSECACADSFATLAPKLTSKWGSSLEAPSARFSKIVCCPVGWGPLGAQDAAAVVVAGLTVRGDAGTGEPPCRCSTLFPPDASTAATAPTPTRTIATNAAAGHHCRLTCSLKGSSVLNESAGVAGFRLVGLEIRVRRELGPAAKHGRNLVRGKVRP